MKTALWLLLLVSGSFFAQGTAELSGSVIDKTSGQPIPYATITLKQNDKVISGAITDEKGNFSVGKLAAQRYDVLVQFMGFKTFRTTADLSTTAKLLLDPIILEDDATLLDEVNIVAEHSTIEQKIDRKVINVGRDLTTAGATASEIMNNIPSVNVDQDGNLSLRGNANVRVLVDGRPTTIDAAQLLKQIPATSIKKIELITNPSAKYNPEGMSGIINIVLHKNANDGFNANVNTGVTVAKTPKFNSSINLNYRRGFVNFFGTYGNNSGKYFNEGDVSRFDDFSRQLIDVSNKNKGHLIKFGMDFYIDDKNTISVYTNQNIFGGRGRVVSNLLTLDPVEGIWQDARYDTDNTTQTYNLAYKKLFEREGETLDVELNHNVSRQDQDASFENVFRNPALPNTGYADDLQDQFELSTANLDYVRPIGERSRLELGAEGRWFRSQNDFVSTNPAFPAADYSYDLDIYSAYATFGQELGKISYQLGARLESYRVKATLNGTSAYEDDYITVYPSASMTYKLSEKDFFQISYSRRVDRPGQNQTKPIREFATPRMSAIGNPELDPQFTNSAEINYTRTFGKGSLSGGVFVRDIRNEINRVLYPDPEDDTKQIMSFDNFDNNTAFGFELSANYKINSWWDMQPAIDFSAISQKGLVAVSDGIGGFNMVQKEANVSAFNGRINNNFKASKKLSFLLFGFYRSAVDGIQFDAREMHKIDLGARYSFLGNKATASVRFNDIFNTQRFAFTGEHPYPQSGAFYWESRSAYVGLNYRFGAGKNRELQRRQREDNTKQSGGGLF